MRIAYLYHSPALTLIDRPDREQARPKLIPPDCEEEAVQEGRHGP